MDRSFSIDTNHSDSGLSLPDDFRLLPGEKLVTEKTHKHPLRTFHKTPSSLEQILRLTHSRSARNIGSNGPSVASLAFAPEIPKSKKVKAKILSPFVTTKETSNTPEHLRLYEVVFGRDSLHVAIKLIKEYPELARATTLTLAKLQGVSYDTSREEEPGRIVHEARDKDDPIARDLSAGRGWGWPYYGTVDATPEFIRTLTAYCLKTEENTRFLTEIYTDRAGKKRNMAYALDMAVDWVLNRLNANDAGLLEYQSFLPKGIENQVWKDSWDAYHHADGTIANHSQGIASIEVQTTTYDALLDAAEVYENVLDDDNKADTLRDRAAQLKSTIFDLFWTDDKGGYFVLGIDHDDDGGLRQLKIRTSNMGHVLNSRLLEGSDEQCIHMRTAVVNHMMSPEMLNISGIRTLANDEVRFRPGAYHNGSVWLWDTHHIAQGLRRHGYKDYANELDRRLLHVIEATKIFPEYVRGDNGPIPNINRYTIIVWDEKHERENQIEQPPQEVQAWTVAAILAIKRRIDREERTNRNLFKQLSDRLPLIIPRVPR